MNIFSRSAVATMPVFQRVLSLIVMSVVIAGFPPLITAARAGDPTAMAPPVAMNAPQSAGINAGADSVFNWQEVPANQQVPLTRAAFDQGGYQLYDTAGETIIVPFTDQNLYVMKFARSATGAMYFLNDGSHPVLYVPRHGYLENAAVAGARWYPFGKGFHPAQPVYLGIAPSWSRFIGMGWYPSMNCYGGYWCQTSFLQGESLGRRSDCTSRSGAIPITAGMATTATFRGARTLLASAIRTAISTDHQADRRLHCAPSAEQIVPPTPRTLSQVRREPVRVKGLAYIRAAVVTSSGVGQAPASTITLLVGSRGPMGIKALAGLRADVGIQGLIVTRAEMTISRVAGIIRTFR